MGEYRSIDEVMGGRDIVPRSDANAAGDGSSLTTADMAGAGTQRVTATAPDSVDTSSDLDTAPATPTTPNDRPAQDRPSTANTSPDQNADAPRQAPSAGSASVPGAPQPAAGDEPNKAPLFTGDQANSLRTRWQDVQAGFVDEPRRAVEQADGLVAEVMQQLARTFADERSNLERQWDHGGDISTEDLRMALRRYRSFFDRLLSL